MSAETREKWRIAKREWRAKNGRETESVEAKTRRLASKRTSRKSAEYRAKDAERKRRARARATEYDAKGRTTNGPRSLAQRHETAGFGQRLEKRVETTGWRPTCEHLTHLAGGPTPYMDVYAPVHRLTSHTCGAKVAA